MAFDNKKSFSYTKPLKNIKVRFYGFGKRDGSCYAEADLPESRETINGIRLTLNGNRVTCEKPQHLNQKWPYEEMSWEKVSSQVIYNYNKMRYSFNKGENSNNETTAASKHENHEINPIFTFTNPERKKCAFAQIVFDDTQTALTDVFVQTNLEDGTVYVAVPKVFENSKNFDIDEWKVTAALVESEFRRQVLNEAVDTVSNNTDISFNRISNFWVCSGDMQLYENGPVFRGFRLKLFEFGKTEITTPASLHPWNHSQYSWDRLREDFSTELKKLLNFTPKENTSSSKIKPEKNHYGRIKNAKHSDFVYFPHSMLRPNTEIIEGNHNKNLVLLATALSKGQKSGIGAFEINALWWISKLKYVTSTMLLDLAAHGYIALGWRDPISQNTLSTITKRMCRYKMIVRSRFCCIDENGDDVAKSVSRIITLAPNGSTLLKELGKDTNRYSPFAVLQDGNTVKRYLVSNQWLIYWLVQYKERIGENYEPAMLLQRKGEEFTMARIYASVTVDNVAMVAEPIRRVDEFEVKENQRSLLDKLGRMIKIFDYPDQTYCFETKIDFPSRPIIVLLCEDDEHIKEVAEIISDLMAKNPDQEFWFTTDLRVFNEDHIGERFSKLKDGNFETVVMAEYFGCDEEIEKQKLIDKFIKDSSGSDSLTNEAEKLSDEITDDDFDDDFDDDMDSFESL